MSPIVRPIRRIRNARSQLLSERHFPDAETFLMVLLNTPDVAVELKVRCAIALLPFQLAQVAERGLKAERQERAEAIKDGPFATPPAPKRPN